MPAVSLAPTIGVFYQAFTVGGIPLNGGKINTYIAGGTTPQATYTSSAGTVQNANPIVLGADGRPPNEIWLVNGSAYRFDITDSNGTLIPGGSYDNVSGIQAASTASFLPLAGGTMAGNIAMGGNKITGLAAATINGDAVRYEQSPAAILTGKGYLISASAANTPSVVSVGSNGQVLTANSNATNGVQWGQPALRSYLSGCGLSTAGGSATMSIAAGTAVDSTNVSAMDLAATSKTTSAWAVGAANGGLDTGAIANSTWYHYFVIQRVDTGIVDVLISLSATSPTMPANYTLFRRIGSGKTDASAHWISFVQDGDYFVWALAVLDVNTTNPGTSAVSATLASVPTGVNVFAQFNGRLVDTTPAATVAQFSDLAITDTAPSSAVAPLGLLYALSTGEAGFGAYSIRTNTSAQIRYRLSASTAATVIKIATSGWIDRRGRDT